MRLTTRQRRSAFLSASLMATAAFFGMTEIAGAQGTNGGVAGKDQITFTKDVAPILQRACQLSSAE